MAHTPAPWLYYDDFTAPGEYAIVDSDGFMQPVSDE